MAWHAAWLGVAVTRTQSFFITLLLLLSCSVWFFRFVCFFKIYCLSLIRMDRAPESVCRNNYPRACMCLWQTVCTCESGGASRVTTQVCEWTRGSPVARWKPNLCNCRWFSFGVCCPQVAKDEYCSLHAAKCNVCTGKYNEWYYRQPSPPFFLKKKNKERKKRKRLSRDSVIPRSQRIYVKIQLNFY